MTPDSFLTRGSVRVSPNQLDCEFREGVIVSGTILKLCKGACAGLFKRHADSDSKCWRA